MVFGGKFRIRRSNSKASYLPRQSLEKLNNTDPDHGSYKLTLNSNEDLVGSTKTSPYDILGVHNGKLPNNLPDVLPLGAKFQNQPQPSSPSSPLQQQPALHYGSNNNISASNHKLQTGFVMAYPTQHRYSTPAMYHSSNQNSNSSHNTATQQAQTPPHYSRSQSLEMSSYNNNNNNNNSANRFMSQSSLDLKKASNMLEPMPEEITLDNKVLAPAQSENNLNSPSKAVNSNKSFSCGQQEAAAEQLDPNAQGRVFRAELVNATLSKPAVIRKDSLRENIEKITQLQSKLMSAHLTESNSFIAGSSYAGSNSNKCPQGVAAKKQQQQQLNAENAAAAQTQNEAQKAEEEAESDNQIEKEVLEEKCISSEQLNQLSSSSLETAQPCESLESAADYVQLPEIDSSTDGLKLMQRSELILCINRTSTAEVASQTDDLLDSEMGRLTENNNSKDDTPARATLQPRQPHALELECEELAKEVMQLLQCSDKLSEALSPVGLKSAADYVGTLYNSEVPLRLAAKRDVGTSTLMRMKSSRLEGAATLQSQENAFELHCNEVQVSLNNGICEEDDEESQVLKRKTNELLQRVKRKLKVLTSEHCALSEEACLNDELGQGLLERLSDKVRPLEATKFRTYVDDVGHITSLLLSLSERLAKAENSINSLNDAAADNADVKILESKRDRLMEQLEEAKRLKEDIDRRGGSVSAMLEKNLALEEVADFDYFINMKAKLIADGRQVANGIKRAEEQLSALNETLTQSDC